jgi:hypothetical protein
MKPTEPTLEDCEFCEGFNPCADDVPIEECLRRADAGEITREHNNCAAWLANSGACPYDTKQ